VTALRLGVKRGTVAKWRNWFVADRLDGLHDEPRPGAPRTIDDDDVDRVIVMTLERRVGLLTQAREDQRVRLPSPLIRSLTDAYMLNMPFTRIAELVTTTTGVRIVPDSM